MFSRHSVCTHSTICGYHALVSFVCANCGTKDFVGLFILEPLLWSMSSETHVPRLPISRLKEGWEQAYKLSLILLMNFI